MFFFGFLKQDKLKKQLKAKLEMARFLQDTLEETALHSNQKDEEAGVNRKFAEFMRKVSIQCSGLFVPQIFLI
jgi:hypothetical protein